MATIAWKIGGDQGEGIDSTGDVVATVASRLGHHVYGYKSFSSRIKGGHTHYKVCLSDHPLRSAMEETHLLVALTQETIDKNIHELVKGGAIVADEAFSPVLPDGSDLRLIKVPLSKIARDLGNPVMRNMVAVGATAALLGQDAGAYRDYVKKKFEPKGPEVVRQNIAAFEEGFAQAQGLMPEGLGFALPPADGRSRLLLTGNEAIALGAVAAGCRIMAAYPITPASDVMEHLVGLFPQVGGVVCQMEDELAAITLVIGAGYGGARAMTATSGPGFSLMQEGMGLAAMAEVPAVIVDCQRAGPSTGMPTKNEQSDVMAAIFGGHGEGTRIVLAPGTVEDAFLDMGLAFNLAEHYQTPVIVASDLALSEWKATVDDLPLEAISIDRGEIVTDEALGDLERGAFQRYALTPSGISPRSLPGQPGGQYLATGVEHQPSGKVSEDPAIRRAEMEKRRRKFEPLALDPAGICYTGPENPDLVVAVFGSVIGAAQEAVRTLGDEGKAVGILQVRRLWPFPKEAFAQRVRGAGAVLFVEANATSQLRHLAEIAGVEMGERFSLLKYDGTLFTAREVAERIRDVRVAEEVS